MGCVYRDDRRSWKVTWAIRFRDVDGRTRRERTKAANKTLARRILAEREDAVEKARLLGFSRVSELVASVPAVTLRQFAKEYLRHVEAQLEPSTVGTYRCLLEKHILRKLGKFTLDRLTPGELQRYVDERQREAAAASVRQDLAVLSGIFRQAMKHGLVGRNPVSLVDKPSVDNPIVRYLDPDEEARLLAFAPESLRSAIVFALHTGLRESEQSGLTWADVRLRERLIVVRNTKSGRDRTVPTSRTLCDTLEWIPRHMASPYVFVNPATGTRVDRFNNTTWRKVLRRAGIKNFRWHDLRHTFGSRLAQAGVPVTAIKELLGHSSIQVTMRYAHLAPTNLREAVSVLDEPREGAGFFVGSTHRSTHAAFEPLETSTKVAVNSCSV